MNNHVNSKKLSYKQIKLKEKLSLSMKYWFAKKKHVYWLTLTSSPESVDAGRNIWNSWQKMVLRFKREFDVQIEYCAVETSEGYGVLHIFLVTDKRLPKCQKMIAEKWAIYHKAPVVWINELKHNDEVGCERLSWYAVTQYAADQGSSFVKAMWSRFTFLPMRASEALNAAHRGLRDIVYPFCPWHITWRVRNPVAEAIVLGHSILHNGFELFYDGMTGELDYLSSPFDVPRETIIV